MVGNDARAIANLRARYDEMIGEAPLTDEQRELFLTTLDSHRYGMGKEARLLRDRIERATVGDELPISDDDPWAAAARSELATVAARDARDAWIALLALSPAMADANAGALERLVWACGTIADPQISEPLATAIKVPARCYSEVMRDVDLFVSAPG